MQVVKRNALARILGLSGIVFAAVLGTACEQTDVVPSGTYEGTIAEVEPEKDEIYVESDGRTLELYFTEATELQRNGEPVPFEQLEQGQRVEVTVEKVGKRLDPKRVVILD